MERLSARLEVKASPDDAGLFEGACAVFGNVDSHRDIIIPGAFTETLTKHREENTLPYLLWQHDPENPVGGWTAMEERNGELWGQGKLWIDGQHPDPHALKGYRMMKTAGIKLGLSIGYRTLDFDIDKKSGHRLLKKVDLLEVSLVTFPSNPLSRVERVKAAGEIFTVREFERFLRDSGGFSRAAAESIAREGFKAAPRDEDGTLHDHTDPRDEDGSVATAILGALRAVGQTPAS